MSSLTYSTKRGAGVGYYGTAKELGKRLERLRTSATMRSNHGVIIGERIECDGTCDPEARCRGWHWWYDPTGDDITPDEGGMGNDAGIERNT